MFKLALRNIISKPLRAVATVLAIAVAVAMIFAMLSFSSAVYEYIYSTQTATSGRSDIVISTNSSSDRITTVTKPLENLEEVEYVCPTLTLYAQFNDEYVQVRGFNKGQSEILQNIVFEKQQYNFDDNEANIVISSAAAKHFGLNVGDLVSLTLGTQSANFYVGAIAEKSGYFLNDAPFLIFGRLEWVSKLILGTTSLDLCNEIYIKANDGVDIDALVERISAMPEYSTMLVKRTGGSYIKEQADSLSAPVVLAGVAVFALAVAVVVLLNMMSEGEKISLISKYFVIGATKKQIIGIFLLESVLLACVGAIVGSALAVGVFVGILKATLSSTVLFSISAWRLFLAGVVGLFSAVLSSLIPILRSFRGTIRQNQINASGAMGRGRRSRLAAVLCPVMIAITILLVIIEFTVPSATAIVSVFSLISALVTLGMCIAPLLRLSAKIGDKISNPSVKVASVSIRRDGRFSRSVIMLGVGMTVSIMLFMAWAMTKSVFSDYVADFSEMVFVTNVQAGVDVSDFEEVNGVDSANKIIWKQGELSGANFDKTMNILGSENALDIIEFGYITPREDIERLLRSANTADKPYVFLDKALTVLYGVQVGDTLEMTVDGTTMTVTVGGMLEHRLFSGNYIVISEHVMKDLFGTSVDTVLLTVSGNMSDTVNGLRAQFANNNYYVVDVLTAYKWEMQSSNAVFDLIGTLAIVVAVFIFAITVFASQVGRGTDEKGRVALLNAGMSKRALLGAEVSEYSAIALISYILSFAASVLLTACLIHALRLFGMYFEFMYEAWVVALVGAVMAAGYALVPVAFNFKKGYTIKKSTR